ncbi:hypothetical protein H2198_008158 [Neophaeococcomyces mojaviensis]|uniref:Uncharacterized protein n=1 Tax=Neophaeococcomyces mojaviensis TaxID=3383035 RepID=A0ACC2ZYB6_9EURO|nr:hypothetical protein H2198_008158 [Knufia sp. JES_112]
MKTCHYLEPGDREAAVKFVFYTASNEPLPFPDLTNLEKRTWHHFQYRTALEVAGPFRSELWSSTILQLAQHIAPVKNALLALSNLHESYASSRESQPLLKYSAMQYYNKAIQQLVKTCQTERTYDALLLTCVMFCAIESLCGNFFQSLQHARSGLQIIAQAHESSFPTNQQAITVVPGLLTKSFFALQSQVVELGNSSIFRIFSSLNQDTKHIPDCFSSVEEALSWLEILINELLDFLDRFEELHRRSQTPGTDDVDMCAVSGYYSFRSSLDRWDQAMSSIDDPLHIADITQHRAYLILKMHRSLIDVLLGTVCRDDDQFDAHSADLEAMLNLAEAFLETYHPVLGPRGKPTDSLTRAERHPTKMPPTFSMHMGIVPFLFLIAYKTKRSDLRNASLRLLRDCNRREGVWDSKWTYSLAKRIIEIKDSLPVVAETQSPSWRVKVIEIGFRDAVAVLRYAITPARRLHGASSLQTSSSSNLQEYAEVVRLN